MKLQTIKDLYFNGSGIFTRYKENYENDFISLYGDTDVQFLDELFLSMYKDKSVSSLIFGSQITLPKSLKLPKGKG